MITTGYRFLAWLLMFSVLASTMHLHRHEMEAFGRFAHHAHEHFHAGDGLWDFLKKHYGAAQTVAQHFKDQHPGEKPFEKPQHKHDFHLTDAALIYFPSHVPAVSFHISEKNFLYRPSHTSLCVRRCVKPPEAA